MRRTPSPVSTSTQPSEGDPPYDPAWYAANIAGSIMPRQGVGHDEPLPVKVGEGTGKGRRQAADQPINGVGRLPPVYFSIFATRVQP